MRGKELVGVFTFMGLVFKGGEYNDCELSQAVTVCMYVARCVCTWHGVYVRGMVCMYVARCVCTSHGVYVRGRK